jgi:hypothetical protein
MSEFSDEHTLRDGVRATVHGSGVHVENVEITSSFATKSHVPFWRRVWFLVSVVPRYLISGSVKLP